MFGRFHVRCDQPEQVIPWLQHMPSSAVPAAQNVPTSPPVDLYSVRAPQGDPALGITAETMNFKLSGQIPATWPYPNSLNIVWFAVFAGPVPPPLSAAGSADVPRVGDIWICTQLGNEQVCWKANSGLWQVWDDVIPLAHHPLIQQAVLLAGSGTHLSKPHWMDSRSCGSKGKSTFLKNGVIKGQDVARHVAATLRQQDIKADTSSSHGSCTQGHGHGRGTQRRLSQLEEDEQLPQPSSSIQINDMSVLNNLLPMPQGPVPDDGMREHESPNVSSSTQERAMSPAHDRTTSPGTTLPGTNDPFEGALTLLGSELALPTFGNPGHENCAPEVSPNTSEHADATLDQQEGHDSTDTMTLPSLIDGLEGPQFPPGTEQVTWANGVRSFLPWAFVEGKYTQDIDVARAMAAAPDALNPADGSEPLVYALDIQSMCQDSIHPSTEDSITVVGLIKEKLSKGIPVLVRGFKLPGTQYKFDCRSLELYKGSLRNTVEYQDAKKRMEYDLKHAWLVKEGKATAKFLATPPVIHSENTLGEFIDMATRPGTQRRPKVCGNLLDPYAPSHAGTPWFIAALNEQYLAMYQNRMTDFAFPPPDSEEARELLEQLVMWDLLTHAGFVLHTHHDAGGAATWMAIRDGVKFWTLLKIRTEGLKSREEVRDRFDTAAKMSLHQLVHDCNMVERIGTICLVPGDVLIQPPNIMHCIYTPIKTLATGGHFYCYNLCHLTELSCDIDRLYGDVTTNPAAQRLIHNLALALPNLADKTLPRVPFLALALMVLDSKTYEAPTKGLGSAQYYPEGQYLREVRGETAYAQQVVTAVLKGNCITSDVNKIREMVHKRLGGELLDPGKSRISLSCLKKFVFVEIKRPKMV
ncbi:hypothetical protein GLOTRDRAFT_131526 [Gloeophyllum trabeum ATCC 11539]|uniref:JmjC domain-containing protein n=1 Tax=Gloeophyllum trabeum (strain ATCC 11539 / FP-39264 / Madison 617) TaxID=670483 RepID=S7Q161_GLOTA|nr:uncharacterized protein GLOTRDRAFT_131526 [Gloeophyllum trabeum ATCC 11539]EPQ53252.1 hypothetical protein GLOTRDRAFT_131526 [Gloeophyllum trabeum ATCC 11539]